MKSATPALADSFSQVLMSLADKPIVRGDVIRMALAARGHSFSSVARDLDVTRPAISATLHGHSPSERIVAYVAALLGVPAELVRGRPLTSVRVARRTGAVNVGDSGSSRQAAGRSVRRRNAA